MRSSRRWLTETAGWICSAFGAAHVIIAPLDTPVSWREIATEGWWDTFTLTASTTMSDFARAETFWISMGSFGVPMLVLGAYTLWAARHGVRIPAWVGVILTVWGLALSTALPISPGWAIPVVGLLLIGADVLRDDRRLDAQAGVADAQGLSRAG